MSRPSPVLFLCLFASQSAMLVLSPILPELARELGVSVATAGQLRSVSGLVGGVTAVTVALLPRRPGLRDLLALGAALITAASLLSAAAPTFAVLALAQAVVGAGVGLLVAVGIAASGEWAQPHRRAHVLAWAIAGMPAAWIAGMPVVGLVSQAGWRMTFLAVPAVAGLAALALVLRRPADTSSRRATLRLDVARFTIGELLANAAWASVLVYAGALLLESYPVTAPVVAFGLGLTAAAMLPGTFTARRVKPTAPLLAALTAYQGGAVAVLGAVRPGVAFTLAVLASMAFVNGLRSMVASAFGMDTAPDDKLAVMAMRAAANQFGYLLGAAAGGLALALGGFPALGGALATLFAASLAVMSAPAAWRRERWTQSRSPA